MVYVISHTGHPLMPTKNHAKIRVLLSTGQAKVIMRCPFTVKLLYNTTEYVQSLTLGVDTGSGALASAVSNSKGEIFYISEVEVRNDIKSKMDQRRKYRRSRRTRKLRYRKPRFLNRKNSIRTDRFSPTMTSKFRSHEKEIQFVKKFIPIKTLILETATFDTHLMKNPSLYNKSIKHWGYQKGPNYGFANTKAMVRCRDNYSCQCCKNKRRDRKLEVHHIIYKSNGGSDDEKNLITLCQSCHKDIHDNKIVLKLAGKLKGCLSYATQMNSIRIQLMKQFSDAIETFGFITTENRQFVGLPKEHYYDACIIATGGIKPIFYTDTVYFKKCISKGDYQKTQGIRSEQKLTTGKILGFRKFDKVRYLQNEYFIKGRMSTGYAILMDIHGNKADFSNMHKGMKTPKLINCKRINGRKSWIISRQNIANIA